MTTRVLAWRRSLGTSQLSAKAYIERESQRLGLQNDNDLVSYVFDGDLRPEAAPLRVRRGVVPGPLLWGGHAGGGV